jgi:hypothetical protein
MALLQIALAVTGVGKSIVMTASDIARLDVGSRYQFHAIVALSLAVIAVGKSIAIVFNHVWRFWIR